MSLTLHGYWRSGAAWRVRVGLALKGLDHASVPHDLRLGEQASPAYLMLNPQALVPALDTGEGVLIQSLAILEWLDEAYPQPSLLPFDRLQRAHVRGLAQLIASDVHPLHNLRVLQALRGDLNASEAQVRAWIARWIGVGLAALEVQVARYGGAFAFGDVPTIADCCLVPQVYSARRFGVDLQDFPRVVAIDAHCATLPAFQIAHPDQQADAS
ncbi:maleylacetoacetate isomerase [Novosphingobium sp.]|uniref:maleylacetoacetate isomerase n=1 Tax=Novosphingobium sp. TaxID=1874826 RepID=UPI0038BB802C